MTDLSVIRSLELTNERQSQDLSIAHQRIAFLESRLNEFELNLVDDPNYVQGETQIEFIQRIAESKSKFAKEAQDIIDGINNA